jgi:2Fe-2S ferredoxin
MTKITFIEQCGDKHVIDVANGLTIMEVAKHNNIIGIIGECGGGCACATCHVYIDDSWIERTGTTSIMEEPLLEFTASEAKPTSRLSCQIRISGDLDGLIVFLPEAQSF